MIVIKMGGAHGIDPEPLLTELAELDEPWILVHGGNEELTELQERLGEPARFITSPSGHTSRFTDAATMANIQRTYRGRINNDLVLRLQRQDCNAVGLSGIDGGLLRATRKNAIRAVVDGKKMLVRDDMTGRIDSVNDHLLRTLIDGDYRPVVTIPALAGNDAVNVDGDRAAAMIAAAMNADTLVILSNVPGLMRDINDPTSLVEQIPRGQIAAYDEFAVGRFKKKLIAADEALSDGVKRVVLATTNTTQPLRGALAGQGTVIQ